jgi:hypothetical protein
MAWCGCCGYPGAAVETGIVGFGGTSLPDTDTKDNEIARIKNVCTGQFFMRKQKLLVTYLAMKQKFESNDDIY